MNHRNMIQARCAWRAKALPPTISKEHEKRKLYRAKKITSQTALSCSPALANPIPVLSVRRTGKTGAKESVKRWGKTQRFSCQARKAEAAARRRTLCTSRSGSEGLTPPGGKRSSFHGEFDPGSGRTLAACLTHASRTELFISVDSLVANG